MRTFDPTDPNPPTDAAHTNLILEEINAERIRQYDGEGWTLEHDDRHTRQEIAKAAACYAAPKVVWTQERIPDIPEAFAMCPLWPWEPESFKRDRHPRRKQLLIAAALLVAEIERIDRKAVRDHESRGEAPYPNGTG